MHQISTSYASLEEGIAAAFMRRLWVGAFVALIFVGKLSASIPAPTSPAAAAPSPVAETAAATPAVDPAAPKPEIYIQEYRVIGAHKLPNIEVEEAVYPFLGPGRTVDDVERARATLEKVYQDKGFQTVSVQIPPQQARNGIVVLQVTEAPVARLRVNGSRYFSLEKIRQAVPSLAVGSVPNFNDVARQIVGLNQWSDRQVTPVLKPGSQPGTVEIDLNVKDTFPLHGSLELNNRYSADTTPLRLNGSISYDNLWQLGHGIGGSFQIAPERLSDAVIYSGYYLARVPSVNWLSLMVQGTRQESNVSTLGGAGVAGNGEIIGGRILITLPPGKGFFESLALGLDYKHFTQDVSIGDTLLNTPITYYPFSIVYSAGWAGKTGSTELTAGITFHVRGMGSAEVEFDNRRFNADGGFIYFRGSLSHTQDLPFGFQLYGEVQGQVANEPLVDSEQFSGGGLDTVRGYLESEVLGDNAIASSIELRTPSAHGFLGIDEWRAYVFLDTERLTLNDPLPDQTASFDLASIGAGTRIHLFKYLNGSLDFGLPLITQANTKAGSVLMTFRLWGDF